MRIRVDEHLVSETEVEVTLYIGSRRTEPILAGAIHTDIDSWFDVLARLEHPYYTVERGPCAAGCGHDGHLGELCLAAMVVDGDEAACPCSYGADAPVPFEVIPDAPYTADEVVAIERHAACEIGAERDELAERRAR